jgi:putative redox protein
MVRIDSLYEGDLHTACVHEPSGRQLETDAPRDNQGRGESFSPTDLLAAGLSTCMLTVMGITARRHGWKLEGVRARVEKHMVEDPQRRVGRLDVRVWMPPGLPPESRPVLERAAHTCPVRQSLHSEIAVDVEFDWLDLGDETPAS